MRNAALCVVWLDGAKMERLDVSDSMARLDGGETTRLDGGAERRRAEWSGVDRSGTSGAERNGAERSGSEHRVCVLGVREIEVYIEARESHSTRRQRKGGGWRVKT